MHNLVISDATLTKLIEKHGLTRRQVEQCFENKCGLFLVDSREKHVTNPPTLWFVAPTNTGRLLKVIFVHRDGRNYLRSAYDADEAAQRIYNKFAR